MRAALRPFGPHPLVERGVQIPVLGREGEIVWALLSPADYRLAMSRRWRLDKNGYPVAHYFDRSCGKSKAIYLHRLVARAPAHLQVDHKRHALLDVRRSQLRVCTPSQNSANTRRLALVGTKSSKYRGVTWHRQVGRWQAACKHNDRCIYLGLFDTEIEAAVAYNRKALELWGAFARVNKLPRSVAGRSRAA